MKPKSKVLTGIMAATATVAVIVTSVVMQTPSTVDAVPEPVNIPNIPAAFPNDYADGFDILFAPSFNLGSNAFVNSLGVSSRKSVTLSTRTNEFGSLFDVNPGVATPEIFSVSSQKQPANFGIVRVDRAKQKIRYDKRQRSDHAVKVRSRRGLHRRSKLLVRLRSALRSNSRSKIEAVSAEAGMPVTVRDRVTPTYPFFSAVFIHGPHVMTAMPPYSARQTYNVDRQCVILDAGRETDAASKRASQIVGIVDIADPEFEQNRLMEVFKYTSFEHVIVGWGSINNIDNKDLSRYSRYAKEVKRIVQWINLRSPKTMVWVTACYGTWSYKRWMNTVGKEGDGIALWGPNFFPAVPRFKKVVDRVRAAVGGRPVILSGFFGKKHTAKRSWGDEEKYKLAEAAAKKAGFAGFIRIEWQP